MQSKSIELINDPNSKIWKAYSEIVEELPDSVSGADLVFQGYELYASRYDTNHQSWRPTSGKVFEYLIIDALWNSGINPIYYQAKVTNITYVQYDVFLYHPTKPVAISCKTSLGERWKQADLEGMVLKQIYRGAHSVLVTMNRKRNNEGVNLQRRIESNEAIGLDRCVVIEEGNEDFDALLNALAMTDYGLAQPMIPLVGTVLS